MVMLNSYKSLDSLCFSDFDVLKIIVDEKQRKFQLDLEGVWLIKNSNQKELGYGYIKIIEFSEFEAKFSNSLLNCKGKANLKQIKQLREINDHKIGNNYLKIFGFIEDGSWLECEIKGGKVEAVFNENQQA